MVWVGNVPPNAHALKGWSLVSYATFGGSRNIRRWDPAGERMSWGWEKCFLHLKERSSLHNAPLTLMFYPRVVAYWTL